MNLVHDPWIPVIFHDGDSKKVSLNNIFTQGENIRDLAANPIQRISLMRVLVCIAQAALDGPEDEEDWVRCRERIPQACLQYLEEKTDRFNLYGAPAFLQVAGLERTHNMPLDKLDFGLAAGNNPNLFDHEATPEGRPRSDEWCALMLVTFQCFSPGGRIGITKWGTNQTPGNGSSEHAPGVEGSVLHTLVRRDDMLATLHANLLTKEQVATLPDKQSSWGSPSWEVDVESPDATNAKGLTQSYLGRLVPLSRAVHLEKEGTRFTLANGLSYPRLPTARETTGTVVVRGKNEKAREAYVGVNLWRHPWRELASVVSLNRNGIRGGALALAHFKSTDDEFVDIWTGGLAADKGKILDMGEWTFAVPTSLLDDSELKTYQDGVELAQRGEFRLGDAIKSCCAAQKADNTLGTKAKAYYWAHLDNQSHELVVAATSITGSLNTTWYPIVRDAMRKAYKHTCSHQTPRQIQAYANGLRKLTLKKLEE